jgi:hypothetical protein
MRTDKYCKESLLHTKQKDAKSKTFILLYTFLSLSLSPMMVLHEIAYRCVCVRLLLLEEGTCMQRLVKIVYNFAEEKERKKSVFFLFRKTKATHTKKNTPNVYIRCFPLLSFSLCFP